MLINQLACVGGAARAERHPSVMQCVNAGWDGRGPCSKQVGSESKGPLTRRSISCARRRRPADVQWRCEAQLDEGARRGSHGTPTRTATERSRRARVGFRPKQACASVALRWSVRATPIRTTRTYGALHKRSWRACQTSPCTWFVSAVPTETGTFWSAAAAPSTVRHLRAARCAESALRCLNHWPRA